MVGQGVVGTAPVSLPYIKKSVFNHLSINKVQAWTKAIVNAVKSQKLGS